MGDGESAEGGLLAVSFGSILPPGKWAPTGLGMTSEGVGVIIQARVGVAQRGLAHATS